MNNSVIFDPLVPWLVLAVLGGIVLAGTLLAVLRGLRGWAMRGVAGLVILLALSSPSFQQEERAPLTDIVILAEDASASQRLSDRADQTESAADALANRIEARANTEVRRITVPDGDGDTGTALMSTLADVLAEEPRARIAGIIALSATGRIHDANRRR